MARPPENQIAREKVASTRLDASTFAAVTLARGDQTLGEWLRELIEREVGQ